MGWFNNNELIKAEAEIKLLRSKNESLVQQLDEIFAKAKADDYACNFVIEFDNIDVFSLERNANRTVIGYWHHSIDSNENEVKTSREWYFHCNTDVHENIFAQYGRYLKYRNPVSWLEEKIDK
jgi:hypothetical protein